MAALIFGCSEEIKVDRGPCQFPPNNLKFPTADNDSDTSNDYKDCPNCFITLNIDGAVYRFTNDQINVGRAYNENNTALSLSNGSELFTISILSPKNADEILATKGQFFPFVSNINSLLMANQSPGAVYLELKDYCKEIYPSEVSYLPEGQEFPVSAYHKVNEVKIIDLYSSALGYIGDFEIKGEFTTYIKKDGKYLSITGSYLIVYRHILF
ncbi:MAG: hypothetical protein HOP30_07625 [Cyclobacteriaceae bacterium]|nr:hypothetical protein [Cyclobacteriaceae bacterium]